MEGGVLTVVMGDCWGGGKRNRYTLNTENTVTRGVHRSVVKERSSLQDQCSSEADS